MSTLDLPNLEEALRALGTYLEEENRSATVVAIGGSALLLIGAGTRPTKDLDVIAYVVGNEFRKARPLPPDLLRARDAVSRLLGLPEDWLNAAPADIMDHGLPDGFEERVHRKQYAALTVLAAGRFDQICFKLHALADREPGSKHETDLRLLNPTREELLTAARWAQQHDPSDGFRTILVQVLDYLGVSDAEEHLLTGI